MWKDVTSFLKCVRQFVSEQLDQMNTTQAQVHDQVLLSLVGFVYLQLIRLSWVFPSIEFIPLLIALTVGGSYVSHRFSRFESQSGTVITPFYCPLVAAILFLLHIGPGKPQAIAALSVIAVTIGACRHLYKLRTES